MRKQFGRLQLIRLQPETILSTGLGITLSDTYDQCVIEWYLFGTVYAPWPHANQCQVAAVDKMSRRIPKLGPGVFYSKLWITIYINWTEHQLCPKYGGVC